MSSLHRTPPTTPKTQTSGLGQTETQSEPDIGSAVTLSDSVTTNRYKRLRTNDSPPEASLRTPDAERYDQVSRISKTLAEQTALINTILSDVGEIKIQNAQIKESNVEIHKSNEAIRESMRFINKQFEDMKKEVEELRKERQQQKQYIENLEKKILDLQQKSRSSGIEIRNIPQENSETTSSLIKTICKIGDVTGVPIIDSSIRDIYRLPGKSATPMSPRPIIAEFLTVQDKQKLVSAVRSYNKGKGKEDKMNTTLIGIPGKAQPVYIAEQLSGSSKKLFYLAREFARNNDYKFCWIANGGIFLRKREGDKQVIIQTEKCLQDLVNINM